MSLNTNKELACEFYRAIQNENYEELYKYTHENFVFHSNLINLLKV